MNNEGHELQSASATTGWHHYYEKELTVRDLFGNLGGQRELLATIYERGPKRILEIGTGSGAMSILFSWLGLDVTSVDLEPAVVEKAIRENAKFNGSAKFAVADAFHLPFPDHSFDLIFHQGLLEHFSDADIRTLIAEQLRCAPVVVISVPNRFYPRRDFGNERLLAKAQWENILSPFKIVESRYYSPKTLPKPWILRAPIQYLAIVTAN
jgi:SAM-dependent methyltransferase